MKKYIYMSIIIFDVGFIIGVLVGSCFDFSLASPLTLETTAPAFTYIFFNNLKACLLIVCGFGILTCASGFMQGLQLGGLLGVWIVNGQSPLSYFVRVLPHSLVEIPALIIAIALGLKIFTLLYSYITSKQKDYKNEIKHLSYWVSAMFILLFIAAIIECSITPIIIRIYLRM